jgi:hypothetical protein
MIRDFISGYSQISDSERDESMRDKDRIGRMILRLYEIWQRHPDYRLGQLIENLKPTDRDLFYVEDDELEKWMIDSQN